MITSEDLNNLLLEKGTVYSGIVTYARLPHTKELNGVKLGVIGIPYDLAVSNRSGTRFGPRAIREMSVFVSKYFQLGFKVWPWDHILQDYKMIDYGDVNFLIGSQESMINEVEKHIAKFVDADVLPLILGGDHFISYPILHALGKKYQKISLVHFDAHTDTLPMDHPKNNSSMFYHAVDDGIIDPARSVQVGLRTDYSSNSKNYHILDANQIMEKGPEWTAREIKNIVDGNVAYLTFDIDFLDPSYAPATGTPEIGGPSTQFARKVLLNLSGVNFIGADLVEVSPPYDGPGQITALAAAQISLDIMHLLCASNLR